MIKPAHGAALIALCIVLLSLRGSAATPNGTRIAAENGVVWQAGLSGFDSWTNARDGQCGTPAQNGATFSFTLKQNGEDCYRNQVQPTDASGGLSRLVDGRSYTWTFRYRDGDASASALGMGPDADARSLIFQIHPYGGGNPCLGLAFYNGGVVGQPQQWLLTNCSGNVWSGPYTAGETVDWKISVVVSQTASGHITLYRNGKLVADVPGATYSNDGGGHGDPWWNFGPYKWRWELPSGGGSTMSEVHVSIEGMKLTSP